MISMTVSQYTQCKLRRDNTTKVAFIPANLACLHNQVSLQDDDTKEWSDGWTVVFVGDTVSELQHVPFLIRQHRKNTGDSLKKRVDKPPR